jgi:hypothetical protein
MRARWKAEEEERRKAERARRPSGPFSFPVQSQ